MADIRLSDGSLIEVKINFLTIKLLNSLKLEKLQKQMQKSPNNKELEFEAVGKLIYAILRSNGKKVDEEEAMMLIPADDSTLSQLITEFSEKMEKFKKKTGKQYLNNDEINWAEILYTALLIGLNEEEFWRCDPFIFYEMVDYHIQLERRKNGK